MNSLILKPDRKKLFSAVALSALLAWPAEQAQAQAVPPSTETVSYKLDTGVRGNAGTESVVAYSNVIRAATAPSKLRVHFSSYNLGAASFVRLTSVRDGGSQKLDRVSLAYWQSTSAIFNGDEVRMELHVAPGDQGVFARVDQLILECDCSGRALTLNTAGAPESLCGADNRIASTDNRVGRIAGCTAWLISNGGVLTAGHCGSGGGVFEANVPASSASGVTVASAPEDQYPIDTSTRTAVNNGAGNDYGIFGLLPNTTTGTRAHTRFGFFRMSRETPAASSTIRITGFGVDNTPAGPVVNCCARDSGGNCTHASCNAQSRTLQTSTGGFVAESGGASDITITYAVDTEPANSGSPVIWSTTGFAIGIHTHGGCTADGGSNAGTSFENDGLENLVANFPGANCRYVDTVTYPNAPADNGTVFQPFHNFASAVSSVPSGGQVVMVTGTYGKATAGNTGTYGTGNKAFTLLAPVGSVTIGE